MIDSKIIITTSDEQCAERMKNAFIAKPIPDCPPDLMSDARIWHIEADKVLCDILISIGFVKTVEEFEKGLKWYA